MDLIALALSLPLMMAFSFLLDLGSSEEAEVSSEDEEEPATDTALLPGEDDPQGGTQEEDGSTAGDGTEEESPDQPAEPQDDTAVDDAGGEETGEQETGEDWVDTPQEEELFPDPEPEDLPQEELHAGDGSDPDTVASDDATASDLFPEASEAAAEADTAVAEDTDSTTGGTLWSSGDAPVTVTDFDPSQDRIALELTDPDTELSLAPSDSGTDTEVQLDGETLLILQGVLIETLPEDAVSGILAPA